MSLRSLVIALLSFLIFILTVPGCGGEETGVPDGGKDGYDGDGGGPGCTTAEDCPAGQGCRTAEGECGPCRVASECRDGEACIDGVCGGCQSSPDCDGLLCTGGECIPCQSPADDQRCRDEYGDPN